MGGRRAQTQQGGPRTACRRHQPFRQAAEFRLGGTRYQRRAGRARGDGRDGRGRPHRRAAKSRHGARRASGRERADALCRFAGSEGVARAGAGFQGRSRRGIARRICRPICVRIKRTASIFSATSRKSSSAAFWPTTWGWAKRCRRSRGWRGSRSATRKIPSRRWSSARRPCCTTGGAKRSGSRRV